MQEILQKLAQGLQYTREMLVLTLILGRTMPMILLTPFFGGKLVPPEVKMGLGLLISILVWPVVKDSMTGEIPVSPFPFLLLMMKEVFIGLAIGFVAAHIFWAMEMAGRIIDTVRGASMSEVLVPQSEARATPVGDLLFQLLIVVFFAIGAHHIFLEAFFFSFAALPLDQGLILGPESEPFVNLMIRLGADIFLIAVVLAAPVLAATFITDVVFGILNRVAPQLNAYFMSMPVKAMAGIIMVLVAMQPLAARLHDYVVWSLQTMEQTLDHLQRPG